ncbi:general secretion pathway protein GspB [Rugamonas sp. CCM 8940]|uniref:general secretion pathway protein GspB n=1 Tax=Rugamonas sp. CCM 8940 TaxID=2765359 RepID=UPI0018F57219|nr:general secretion pathway protein GspB [Rugamonas sp. CCM 8940]MBJ7311759.1 general secretion pathway protein GspB [Rugamonas sp. CCM 8940]
MSYILEALKKSQAERQLGALPTIHAPSLHGEVAAASGAAWKKPLPLAVMAMAAIIVALLALVWRQPSPAVAPVSADAGTAATPAVAGNVAAPAAPATSAAATTTATNPSLTVAPSAPVAALSAPTAVAQPVAMPPAPVEPVETLKPSKAAAAPTPGSTLAERPEPVRKPASPASTDVAAHAQPLPSTVAPAAPDDTVQSVRELPEPIQRAIPPIAVGGYIYSKNPADRLLLIDKVLRHEGEEVAAGLVLEKLLPKAAVFNYKGYRYRVPY